ncbi:MAG: hypothetical protein VB050_02315 [Geobacteraceae bacterium]|nr:hypothetical protein [Geobacteraceae bacterium]
MDPANNRIFITDLIKTDFPQSVYEEVRYLISLVYLGYDFSWLSRVFKDVVNLYGGNFPGYRECNTPYHDLKHVTDAMLVFASLVHGAFATGLSFREKHVTLALISILLHETGYIQRDDDTTGTGAKYTLVRAERSVEFLEGYFTANGYDDGDCKLCRDFIICTDINEDISEMSFESPETETIAKMVATASIIGQISDRTYLEKLLFLFQELNEAQVFGFQTELDLLSNTMEFYEHAKSRLENELGGVQGFLAHHFLKRWEIDYDMYADAIESNLSYLGHLLENHRNDYREKLNRGGLLKRLAILEKKNGK